MLTNADRKLYTSLSMKKYRDLHRLFLVEGRRSVEEAVSGEFDIRVVLATAAFAQSPQAKELLGSTKMRGVTIVEVSEREMAAVADTVQAQGIAAIVETKKTSLLGILSRESGDSLIICLDAVSDPGNLGTIIRTCDWFGVDGIILGKGCVDLYSPKVVRGSMGSVFHIPIAEGVDLEKSLSLVKESGFAVYATDVSTGKKTTIRTGRTVIVLGSEAHGVSSAVKTLSEGTLTIPRYGQAESLNVSVACGVILSEIRKTR